MNAEARHQVPPVPPVPSVPQTPPAAEQASPLRPVPRPDESDFNGVPTPILQVKDGLEWVRFVTAEAGTGLFDLLLDGLSFSYELTKEITGSRLQFVEELLRSMDHSRRRFASREETRVEQLRGMENELSLRRSTRRSILHENHPS